MTFHTRFLFLTLILVNLEYLLIFFYWMLKPYLNFVLDQLLISRIVSVHLTLNNKYVNVNKEDKM